MLLLFIVLVLCKSIKLVQDLFRTKKHKVKLLDLVFLDLGIA